jgi:serine/threonine protein kinase
MTSTISSVTRRELKRIGKYDLIEAVGKGGCGSVYRATDRETGAVVAVKVLAANLADNPKLHYRFAQEFQAASRLEHPNIVRAIDFGMDGKTTYLAMEFVEGHSLGDLIVRHKRLPEGSAVRIITQVAQALDYAHKRQIIHRDVKPDNILVRADGRAKLADFGLAKDVGNDRDLTRPSTALGTPHFMAPEQYDDAKRVDVRADVYSLGATLYMAVTGRAPFDSCTSLEALGRKIKGEIDPPNRLCPDLSQRANDAIVAALRPRPVDRPAGCLQFVKMLTTRRVPSRTAAGGLPDDRNPADRRAAVRHSFTLAAACAIDTAVAGGGADTTEDWPAVVRDISATGLGLILARRFEPGTELTVDLDLKADAPPKAVRVKVVNVRPDAMGHWRHGCAITAPMTDGDLLRLL